MPALSSEAIILQHKPAGESDLVVDFLCPDLGRLKGIAKGAKKSKKRFSQCLEPLSRSRLELFEKPSQVWIRIDSGELIEPFNGIRGDFRKWGLAAFACELIQGLVPFRDPNRQTYDAFTGYPGDSGPGKRGSGNRSSLSVKAAPTGRIRIVF